MTPKRFGQTLLMVVGMMALCLGLYAFMFSVASFTVYEIFMTALFSIVMVSNYLNVFDNRPPFKGEESNDSETVKF